MSHSEISGVERASTTRALDTGREIIMNLEQLIRALADQRVLKTRGLINEEGEDPYQKPQTDNVILKGKKVWGYQG